jgi:hypothetical protein
VPRGSGMSTPPSTINSLVANNSTIYEALLDGQDAAAQVVNHVCEAGRNDW